MELAGLTQKEAEEKAEVVGLNKIPEEKKSTVKKFLQWLISPIALMLLTAAILSFAIQKTFDAYFILGLMFLNFFVAFWQENKADNAIQKLNQQLISKVRVLRDGKWHSIESQFIVPGDILEMNIGEIIPADGEIVNADNLSVNEAVLTGESLSKEKKAGDKVYSGSFVLTGIVTIRVTATGRNTGFGKTLLSVERTRKRSALEEDILRISKFLIVLSMVAVVILTIFLYKKDSVIELLQLDLSIIIAGIPISLPTVMTLVMEFGAIRLANQGTIVRRLSALEDFANVNLLLTDKTGTLTKNEISVQEVVSYGPDEKEILKYAFYAAAKDGNSPISRAIMKQASYLNPVSADSEIVKFTPADSERKRSTTTVRTDKKLYMVTLGAPQIVSSLCETDRKTKVRFENDVDILAKKGYRTLAVAINTKNPAEEKMDLVGILALSDTVLEDAAEAISFMEKNGIDVKIVTGDNRSISAEVAKKLGLEGNVVGRDYLDKNPDKDSGIDRHNVAFDKIACFSEILPEDKYRLVQAAKKDFIVASTGDGVNDLAAIKEANVGIAVKNAVDALKSAADIVLVSSGISVIKEAIIESRRIFARLYTYSVYRISESIRLIVTIAVLGLLFGAYPLTPLQLIVLALLNDIPIISLAFDRVKIAAQPAKINVRERFVLSSLFGFAGVANSLLLFYILTTWAHVSWTQMQAIFFLKLAVSGHMLIYIAHTEERWFRYLPSMEVISATFITQIIATILALTGIFMSTKISLGWAAFIWIWALFWMQVSDSMKDVERIFMK